MIRQDVFMPSELPPRFFLEQIMDDLAKSYFFLWDRKNQDNKIMLTWKDLSKYFNKNNFKTNLRKLNNEGLLSYEEYEEGIEIELVGWDDFCE